MLWFTVCCFVTSNECKRGPRMVSVVSGRCFGLPFSVYGFCHFEWFLRARARKKCIEKMFRFTVFCLRFLSLRVFFESLSPKKMYREDVAVYSLRFSVELNSLKQETRNKKQETRNQKQELFTCNLQPATCNL